MQIKVKSFPYALCYFSSLITIKVFEDVVEILDPEMNIDSEIGEEEMQVETVVNCYLTILCMEKTLCNYMLFNDYHQYYHHMLSKSRLFLPCWRLPEDAQSTLEI